MCLALKTLCREGGRLDAGFILPDVLAEEVDNGPVVPVGALGANVRKPAQQPCDRLLTRASGGLFVGRSSQSLR